MKVLNWGALAGAVVLAAVTLPVAEVHAQSTILRAVEAGRGARIGASVSTDDNKELTTGVILASVEPGGPADKAGVKPGDVLVSIDGKPIADPQGVLNAVTGIAPGSTARVKMKRKGQDLEIAVAVGRRPKQQVRPE